MVPQSMKIVKKMRLLGITLEHYDKLIFLSLADNIENRVKLKALS